MNDLEKALVEDVTNEILYWQDRQQLESPQFLAERVIKLIYARRLLNLTPPETIDALEAKTIRWFNTNAHKGDQGLSLQEAREFVSDLLRSVEEGET